MEAQAQFRERPSDPAVFAARGVLVPALLTDHRQCILTLTAAAVTSLPTWGQRAGPESRQDTNLPVLQLKLWPRETVERSNSRLTDILAM
ncbi:hypothetical protein EYF80_010516 [Liparis tanakae]|uniref:Uncharacterized protein n=1 Tax=Liparis tanakae TaxID=230148 RepID=A0A4Z2INA8_9TELE|nr:hypothetical protein EYF80_010516 [Liparis tanakae]